MTFQYTDLHRDEYYRDGYTILRGLIPAALLGDLRRETDKARVIARAQQGAQTQRLQPVYAYDEIDARPFRDFLQLPGLRAAVEGILGPDHEESDNMGVLLEPAEAAWCTHWHRDWAHNVPHVDQDAFFEAVRDQRMFNQFNGALYDDHSLWAVPGSQERRDSEAERAAFPVIPAPAPDLPDVSSPDEREMAALAYTRRMPGGTPVWLCAGDVAFYRSCLWHIGNYVPYAKRATLHDGFYCEADYQWRARVKEWGDAARAAAA
jgi:hypothetical protein